VLDGRGEVGRGGFGGWAKGGRRGDRRANRTIGPKLRSHLRYLIRRIYRQRNGAKRAEEARIAKGTEAFFSLFCSFPLCLFRISTDGSNQFPLFLEVEDGCAYLKLVDG
jgi:hypothetical protein